MSIVWSDAPQGSEEWLDVRRGCITGSMFKIARDKLKGGQPSAKALLYAMNTARERCGGKAPEEFVNAAMRFGTEQEPAARMAYEDQTGNMVEAVGFAFTNDGKFGCSVDGLVDSDGIVEIKTMVSSETLFRAVVDGDISEYRDQINGALWLLGRKWCDLCLWAPDLPFGRLTVIRIERDESAIEALEEDLLAFERLVTSYAVKLGKMIALPTERETRAQAPHADAPLTMPAATQVTAPSQLPADLFGACA